MRDGIQSLSTAIRKAIAADPDNVGLRRAKAEVDHMWQWYSAMMEAEGQKIGPGANHSTPELQAAAQAAVQAMRRYPTG
jgi:hypothetical protein